MILLRRTKSFFRMATREKLLFAEALLYQYGAKLFLFFFPFRYCVKLFATANNNSHPPTRKELWAYKVAILRGSRFALWENKCIVMSLAARWMLERRNIPSSVHLGVIFDEQKNLKAHAWIKAGELEIVENPGGFKELYAF